MGGIKVMGKRKILLIKHESLKNVAGAGGDLYQCPYCSYWFNNEDYFASHVEKCKEEDSNSHVQKKQSILIQ